MNFDSDLCPSLGNLITCGRWIQGRASEDKQEQKHRGAYSRRQEDARTPARPSTLIRDSKSAMPQRALIKNPPWIYIAADEMSEYDLLAEQQLTAMDPRTSLNNDLAFGDTTKPTSTVASSTKRKRPDHAMTQDSPSKRLKLKETKPAAKKLGIPKKVRPLRHMINTIPVVRGDIYEFANDNSEKQHLGQAANTKMQRTKKAAPRSEMIEAPGVDRSSPDPKPPRTAKRSTRATATAEGQGSAFLNGRVDLSTTTGRKVGRSRKRKNAIDLTEEPGRKGVRPNKQTPTVDQGPTPSPMARGDGTKHREAIHDANRAISGVRKGSKGSPQKAYQATLDNDDDGDASDAAEGTLRQEKSDDNGEANESDAGTDVSDKNLPSGQDESEEVLEDLEGQESNSESSSQVDNHDEVAEEHMDLLGQHREWDKVLKSAKSVHKTKIKTKRIKELHDEIKEARSLYKKLGDVGGLDHDALKRLNGDLQESLYSIEDQINDISEHNTVTTKLGTINDIYGRAIPAMVFLLERALSLYTSQPRGLHDFHALGEIIRIQDMTLQLCEKAKSWKVKPNATYPIIKPTTSVISPYIRDMRNKFFFPKLNLLRVREKVKANALKTAKEKAARFEQSQREAEDPSQGGSQRDPRILCNIEEEAQRRRTERNRGRRVLPVLSVAKDESGDDRATSVQPLLRNGNASAHNWTEEETQELVVQLYQSRDLPGE